MWGHDNQVPNTGISSGPSSVVFNGQLYCFHQGFGDNGELWFNVFDGTNWAGDNQVPNTGMSSSPSAVVFNGRLYCFHQGFGGNGEHWFNVFDGTNWAGDNQVPNTGMSSSPSAMVFNGRLYCFHQGFGDNGELWYTNGLPLIMQHQTQSNWCWAAVGASVGNFYSGLGTFTQCGIANACQGKSTCCSDPGGCNQYGFLELALQAARSFDSTAAGSTSFAIVRGRVDMGEPVGTRVAWNGGGAHFMMIAGYDNSGNTITIEDPWYGESTIAFASYPSSYQSGGSWTHTYYTKKQ